MWEETCESSRLAHSITIRMLGVEFSIGCVKSCFQDLPVNVAIDVCKEARELDCECFQAFA